MVHVLHGYVMDQVQVLHGYVVHQVQVARKWAGKGAKEFETICMESDRLLTWLLSL